MVLVELTYIKAMTEVERFVDEHRKFLDQKYSEGFLIFSGPKKSRSGGIILVNTDELQSVEELIHKDPFYREQIADYKITEFSPTKFDERFRCFLT
jgi:uncharacterized protein YciI